MVFNDSEIFTKLRGGLIDIKIQEWRSMERILLPRPNSPLGFDQAKTTSTDINPLTMPDFLHQDPCIIPREIGKNIKKFNVNQCEKIKSRI